MFRHLRAQATFVAEKNVSEKFRSCFCFSEEENFSKQMLCVCANRETISFWYIVSSLRITALFRYFIILKLVDSYAWQRRLELLRRPLVAELRGEGARGALSVRKFGIDARNYGRDVSVRPTVQTLGEGDQLTAVKTRSPLSHGHIAGSDVGPIEITCFLKFSADQLIVLFDRGLKSNSFPLRRYSLLIVSSFRIVKNDFLQLHCSQIISLF